MIISQTLARLLKAKKHNNIAMVTMLTLAVVRIGKQGDGCYDETGVRYFNPVNKTMDSIYIIMDRSSSILKYYGSISEENQKPLINMLFKKFNISPEVATVL